MERPTGVTILAVLSFIGAAFLGLMAIGTFLGGAVLSRMVTSMPAQLVGIGTVIVAAFCLLFAGLYTANGIGLLKVQNWARIFIGRPPAEARRSRPGPYPGRAGAFPHAVRHPTADCGGDRRSNSVVSVSARCEEGIRRGIDRIQRGGIVPRAATPVASSDAEGFWCVATLRRLKSYG